MNLIHKSLELVRQRLNGYFQAADPLPEDWIVLSNIVDQDGRVVDRTRNKVVMFLANIQQDNTISTWRPATKLDADRFAITQPPVYINLFVMFYANFSDRNYGQALETISRTIQFFQQNPYFDRQNLPDLPEPIEKLAFEFTNLDAVGLNYLMGLAGVKYLPSVYYKVRMFPFRSDAIQEQVSSARGYSVPSSPNSDPATESGAPAE